MDDLAKEHPQEYPKGTPPLTADETRKLQGEVGDWQIDGGRLTRELVFRDFKQSFAFVTRVALLAEAEGHHPDLFVSWNKVRLTFWTHTAEGLTRNDFIMAAKIDSFAG